MTRPNRKNPAAWNSLLGIRCLGFARDPAGLSWFARWRLPSRTRAPDRAAARGHVPASKGWNPWDGLCPDLHRCGSDHPRRGVRPCMRQECRSWRRRRRTNKPIRARAFRARPFCRWACCRQAFCHWTFWAWAIWAWTHPRRVADSTRRIVASSLGTPHAATIPSKAPIKDNPGNSHHATAPPLSPRHNPAILTTRLASPQR